jgi:hypothetical protein
MITKSKKKEKNENKTSKKSETISKKKESDSDEENVPINKVHIYNNNRHLQKSNSAGSIRLFFEPYYSELKNSTNNNLFNSKPVKKSILQIEYVNLPKIDRTFLESKFPEQNTKKKKLFPDNDIRGYNNYNINYYNNNSYGMNNYNYNNNNGFPNINKSYNYNNFGYNNKYNQGYDYNNYYNDDNYYRRKELGELYSQVFLSRDNTNDLNSKIRNYYIKSIDQPSNNDRLFNYNRLRNNPRKYTFKNIKKDDIILNDIKASRKYREFVFFQNLKKYIEPHQSIIDEDDDESKDKKRKISIKSKKSEASSLPSIKNKEKEKEPKKEDKKSKESNDEEEEEESDEEDKDKKEKKKEEKNEQKKEEKKEEEKNEDKKEEKNEKKRR